MRFSIVFAVGVAHLNGKVVGPDRRLYHFDLVRGCDLLDDVEGTCGEVRVVIPAIDFLGVIRALHGTDAWHGSGAAAWILGGRRVDSFLPIHPALGQFVAQRRQQLGIEVKALAQVLRWPKKGYEKFEERSSEAITIDELFVLAAALDLAPLSLLSVSTEPAEG